MLRATVSRRCSGRFGGGAEALKGVFATLEGGMGGSRARKSVQGDDDPP